MIELLQLGRQHGFERLTTAIEQALSLGVTDAAAVAYLLRAASFEQQEVAPLAAEEVKRAEHFARPMPEVASYDDLLGTALVEAQAEVGL